jgi:hypothetical protein
MLRSFRKTGQPVFGRTVFVLAAFELEILFFSGFE